jgi:pimeloyl-ACP methyl ester carboxylesterase
MTRTAAQAGRARLGLAALFALSSLLLLASSTGATAARGEAKPTVVLVHGAWADSSGWSDVVRRLQHRGYDVVAPATPLRSLSGDAAYLRSFLEQTAGRVIVVGHSYGGAVITNAVGGLSNVDAIVYVNAFVPDIGEDALHLAGADSLVPTSIEFKGFPPFGPTDVDIYIKQANFHETVAGDLSAKEAAVLAATQRPIALTALVEPTTATAWRTISSWYLLGREDRTITPSAQRSMATRAGSTIVEVDAAHLSMLSKPKAVVELIEQAAAATD